MDEQEFIDGYLDGRDFDNPEPSANRSHSYRHSFAVGRREVLGKVPVPAHIALDLAEEAAEKDALA